MEPKKQDIDTALLSVDLTNFRIGDQDTTRDAYKAMIEEEGDDLVNLADDIIKLGLSPAELLIVVPDPETPKHFIVTEGNRRLTAIRLLETPALAAGTSVHKAFLAMSKDYVTKPIKKISCVIMKDKDEAFNWAERKHRDLGGRGVAQWGADATTRADAFRGKVRPSMAVVEHLKAAGALPKALEKKLAGKSTNLDRVFQMPYLASSLGVKVDKAGTVSFENGDSAKGNDLLVRILKAMTADGFTVNHIRHASDRKDFIDIFNKYAVTGPAAGGGGDPSGSSKAATKAAKKSTSKASSPLDRKCLALKGREYELAISEPRLHQLYVESKKLDVANTPNSAAVLTRVFLELTTDHYLIKKAFPLPPFHVQKGRSQWTDIGISLKDKVGVVLKELDPQSKNNKLKEARKGQSTADALHSIEALHDFIHHLQAEPDPSEIKRIWSRWHHYFEAVFEAVK